MSLVRALDPRGKYVDRPADCPFCASLAWWNGQRVTSSTRKGATGVKREPSVIRLRACCSAAECSRSWTVYEEGAYPHRSFQLEVIASAVAAVEAGGTLTKVAAEHLCSRRSVRRWIGWVAGLGEPRDLEQLAARVDPDAALPALQTTSAPRALVVLQHLDRLADLLALRGVSLLPRGPGLLRVLVQQMTRFRDVFFLCKPSPPLRADPEGLPV